MSRFDLLPALLLTTAVFAACEQSPTTMAPSEPNLARSECGGSTDLLDSRSQLTFDATTAIRGDGVSNTISGTEAGVGGKIYYYDGGCSRSGDMVFSIDAKSKRRMTFFFPAGNDASLASGGVAATGGINLRALMQLGSDVNKDGWAGTVLADGSTATGGRDARIEAKTAGSDRAKEYPDNAAVRPDYPTFNGTAALPLRFKATRIAGCEELEYPTVQLVRNSGSFSATGQHAADGSPLGQWDRAAGSWTAQSVETPRSSDGALGHWAQCYAVVQGRLEKNGSPMNMPFAVAVAEILR